MELAHHCIFMTMCHALCTVCTTRPFSNLSGKIRDSLCGLPDFVAVQRQAAAAMSKKGQKMDLGTFLGASRGPALSNLPSGPDPNREYVAPPV